MSTSSQNLEALSVILGRPVSTLRSDWFASHRPFISKEWETFLAKHGNEISYVTDEEQQPGKIYVLKKNKDGYYTGSWVDPSSMYDRAILNEDYDRALGLAEQYLCVYPNDPRALFQKAYALSSLGRTEESIDYYSQLLAIEPDNDSALNNKGVELASLGDGEAMAFYKRAHAIDPTCILYKKNIANAYLHMGFLDEHAAMMEEVFNSQAYTVEDRLLQHNIKQKMGWHTRADFELSKADFLRGGSAKLRSANDIKAATNDEDFTPPAA